MRIVALAVAAAALAVFAAEASAYRKAGLSVRVPRGWHVVHRHQTPCINPAERLTLAGRGAMVVLLETLDPRHYVLRFPRRPAHFRVTGKPSQMECCAVRGQVGWELHFRAAGRGFYAFVYPGRAGSTRQALRILDGLRVRPR